MRIEKIETPRLYLRNYEKTDMEFVMSIWNDPEMGKYMPDPTIDNMDEDYRHAIETMHEENRCCYLISESKETGERIGTCSFIPSEDGLTYDLGYCVHMRFWRQGYATEMAQGMMDYARMNGAKYITVSVNKENTPSNAIMKKFGFAIVGEGKFKKRNTEITMEEYRYRLDL